MTIKKSGGSSVGVEKLLLPQSADPSDDISNPPILGIGIDWRGMLWLIKDNKDPRFT